MVIESSGFVSDEYGEFDLREDDGVVITGVGIGFVIIGIGCVGGMSGVFFLFCFSGFLGFVGFGVLIGFLSLLVFFFILLLRK